MESGSVLILSFSALKVVGAGGRNAGWRILSPSPTPSLPYWGLPFLSGEATNPAHANVSDTPKSRPSSYLTLLPSFPSPPPLCLTLSPSLPALIEASHSPSSCSLEPQPFRDTASLASPSPPRLPGSKGNSRAE